MNKRRILLSIAVISIVFNIVLVVVFKSNIKAMISYLPKHNVIHSNERIHRKYSCYMYCDSISDISLVESTKGEIPFLPNKLIVAPGIYKVGKDILNMNKEGLYRIIFPNENNYQIIVYKKDLKSLLASIAWIHSHGDIDNKLSVTELSTKAIHDKIYLTCSRIASFSAYTINNLGYHARIVGGIAIDGRNGFDDEHTLIEIFEPSLKKWIVADIDNNSMFKRKGKEDTLLSFIEFRDALYADDLEQVVLSKDVKFDISGYKSKNDYTFGFIMERLSNPDELLKWYKRIFRTMIIQQEFYSTIDAERIKKEHQTILTWILLHSSKNIMGRGNQVILLNTVYRKPISNNKQTIANSANGKNNSA